MRPEINPKRKPTLVEQPLPPSLPPLSVTLTVSHEDAHALQRLTDGRTQVPVFLQHALEERIAELVAKSTRLHLEELTRRLAQADDATLTRLDETL